MVFILLALLLSQLAFSTPIMGRRIGTHTCTDSDLILHQQESGSMLAEKFLDPNPHGRFMLPPYILPIFPIIIHPHPPHPQHEGENIPTAASPPPPARAETKTWNLWVENVCPCGSVVEILLDCPGFQSSWVSHNSTTLVVNGDGTCSLRNGSAFAYTHANMSTISVSIVVWSKNKCNTGL